MREDHILCVPFPFPPSFTLVLVCLLVLLLAVVVVLLKISLEEIEHFTGRKQGGWGVQERVAGWVCDGCGVIQRKVKQFGGANNTQKGRE